MGVCSSVLRGRLIPSACLALLILLLPVSVTLAGLPVERPGVVRVDKLRLYLGCIGRGEPAVIFDSGSGDSSDAWEKVQPAISHSTRACVYDRANLGRSGPGPRPTTSSLAVWQLHELLRAARVQAPYILVGHSYGGMNVRLYAHRYSHDVAGLVLVDASVSDEQLLEDLPAPAPGQSSTLKSIRAELQDRTPDQPEDILWRKSERQVNAVHSLGALPTLVLSHGQPVWPAGLSPAVSAKLETTWSRQQERLAHLSTNSAHVIALYSGHVIQRDQPDLVVHSIEVVLGAVRGHTRVPSCDETFPSYGGRC